MNSAPAPAVRYPKLAAYIRGARFVYHNATAEEVRRSLPGLLHHTATGRAVGLGTPVIYVEGGKP